MGKSMLPTPENVKKMADRFEKTKQRVGKLVEKKIDPVYFDLAEKIGGIRCKESKYAPWILEKMMTPQQARISLALPDTHREPSWGKEHQGVTEQFAKDLDLDKETVDKDLEELAKQEGPRLRRRFVSPTRNGYQVPRGSHFFTHGGYYEDRDLADMCWVFGRFEEAMNRHVLIEASKARGGKLPGFMIIPRWKAVKDIPEVLPIEDMREVLKAHKRFALISCICRTDDLDRDCGTPEEVCLTFDRGADVTIANGTGRELTLTGVLDWYDSLRDYPITSFPMGGASEIADPKELGAICNCHWDCCLAMMGWYMPYTKYEVTDWIMKARFRATVNPEKCIGCRVCIDERCQFWGAQMKYYPEFSSERAYVDEEKCAGCGLCVETCPVGARDMKAVAGPEYITEIGEEEGAWGGVRVPGQGGPSVELTLKAWEELDKEKKLAEEKKP